MRTARPAAGRDLRPGDVVVVETADAQLCPPEDDPRYAHGPVPARRVTFVPHDAGTPRRVVAVTLPFVHVHDPEGYPESLDLRLTRLRRLGRKSGAKLFVRMHPAYARETLAKAAKRRAKRDRKRTR